MGLIDGILAVLFGGSRNVVKETAEVFRVNAENEAGRELSLQGQVLEQFGKEFRLADRSRFDEVIDALNRVPRPAMALGTLALFVSAMVDPVWFAARMAGIALVPEPLWWLLAAIVSFYFGARHQAKGQQFQRDLAQTIARVPQVVQTVREVEALRDVTPARPEAASEPAGPVAFSTADEPNAALRDWLATRG
ncbi:holin family protein [Citreimonas salinaria]|uniref:Holin of 3TMs, for gene-transfer release n=1 Tax=Citreimonas salinaria TaxID=321339 RepID=A0A1H3G7I3_9RHOB|nr:holin family protein [Citreimonas salinaria]SDX98608.1 Holin of 3TMs, for gene-transfer release [Citreimonas salinaria]